MISSNFIRMKLFSEALSLLSKLNKYILTYVFIYFRILVLSSSSKLRSFLVVVVVVVVGSGF
jgi:hypothetical protein